MTRFLTLLLAIQITAYCQAQALPDPPRDPVSLIRGDTLEGWHVFVQDKSLDAAAAWQVRDGVLSNPGPGTGYIRTTSVWSDYRLNFDYRWPQRGGNSGVMVHISNGDLLWPKAFQAELQPAHTGDFVTYSDARAKEEVVSRNPRGASTGRLPRSPADAPEKPVGEWNAVEVLAEGTSITVTLNGLKVNQFTQAIPSAGMIGFQAEGSVVELRNIVLTPLPPAKDLHAPMPAR